jgi:hypothetical protein
MAAMIDPFRQINLLHRCRLSLADVLKSLSARISGVASSLSWIRKTRRNGALLRSSFDHNHPAAGESVQVQDSDRVDLGTKNLTV